MFVCNFPPDSSLFTGSFIGNPAFPLIIQVTSILYERCDLLHISDDIDIDYVIKIDGGGRSKAAGWEFTNLTTMSAKFASLNL